jgi:hypothetical protein
MIDAFKPCWLCGEPTQADEYHRGTVVAGFDKRSGSWVYICLVCQEKD